MEQALVTYEEPEQDMEAVSYAAALLRETYPDGSQALHMMNHNTGVLASYLKDALYAEYDNRGIDY